MIRRAFTMRLKPGKLDEYRHHHDRVWPDMVAEIERSGIGTMSIFHGEGDRLFLFSEVVDDQAWDRLWNSATHARWAEVMSPLMDVTPDGKVDAAGLTELFHLATNAGSSGK